MKKRRIVRSAVSWCMSLALLTNGTIPAVPLVSTVRAADTVTITPGTDEAKTGTGQMTISLKIKETLTPTVTLDGWMYSKTPNEPSVEGNTGNGKVTYSYKVKDADDATYSPDKPTAPGDYTVRAQIGETDDYKAATATADFTIAPLSQSMTITLIIHGHSFSYSANGAKITATCSGEGTCDLTSDPQITLVAPAKQKDTDSLSAEATIEGLAAFNTATGLTISAADIAYYSGTTKLDAAPTAKGDYTAKLTIGDATAEVPYSIGTTTQTSSMSITLVIKADPTVTAPAAADLTYSGKAQALVSGGATDGGTLEYALGTDDQTAPTTGFASTVPTGTDAGTYYVWYRVTGDDAYKDAAPACVKVTIAKKALTVTAPTANELTYDGTAQELVKAGSAVEGTMQYRLGTDGAWSADIPTAADAGTYEVYYKTTGNGNYKDSDVSATPVTVTIAPAALTITAKDASIVYGEAPKNNGVKDYTLFGEDTLSGELTYTYSYKQYGDVGEYTITPAGLSNENYDITFAAGKLTVSAKPVTLTWAENTAFTYDGAEHSVTAAINGLVNEDAVTLTYQDNAKTAAGNYTATAALAGDKAKNYALSAEGKAWSIGKAAITPAVVIEGWTYGSTANEPTVTGNTGNGAVTYTYYQGETALDKAPTDAGTYTVKAAIAETANYKAGAASKEFTISQKALTITANDAEKVYGTDDPALTYADVKLVGEDKLTGALSRAEGEDAGEYAIKQGTLTAGDNYAITFVPGKFTIASADFAVEASGFSGVYDGKAHGISASAKIDGTKVYYLVSDEKPTEADFTKANQTTSPTYTDAGTYKVWYCITAQNYKPVISYQTVEITKAEITPAVAIEGWTFGEKANAPTVSGNTGNGAVSYSYYQGDKALDKAPTDAGTYTVKAAIAETANYKAGVASKGFTISKAAITPAVEIEDWTFGSKANAPSVTGNIGNGAVTYTYYQGETALDKAPTDAGTYTVKAAIAETANYKGATASKEFTISKAAITPAVAVESWTFGEKANEPTVSGNTGNGDVTYTYYQGDKALDKAPTDAGTYTVKATIAETANYKAGEASAEFNIINAEFQVTAKGFAGTYDGKAHGISASTKVEGAKVYFSAEKLDEAGFVKSNQTASPAFKDAGEYTVWYCITTPNYKTVIGSETVKIAQREITITADSLTSEYGADILPLTYKLTGEIVTGDDLGIKLATNADKNTAGKYDITVSYTKNANYAVTVVNGSYTVKDAPETTTTTATTTTTTTSTQATTTTSTQLTTTTTQETTTTTTEPETTTTQATTTTTTEATTATTQATTTSTTAPTTTEPPTTTKAKIKIVSGTSKEVPDGWYASLGGFEEMAWRDFEDKHPGDERVFYADVKQIDENTVECSIYEWMGDHKPLDVYTIDVRTGVGTNQAGEEIDLPQTGVTTKHTIAAVGSAIAATMAGLWLTIRAARRKKDEE